VTINNTEELLLNMGPQHPSMHGLFRMVVNLEGETVTKIEPKIGYLHRGMEKLAESRTYSQFIPYTDRLDYLASPHNNWAYVQTVEKLMGVEIPERAEYLRVIFGELARIASHQVCIASTALDMAGWSAWSYAFRDRERICDMYEMTAGSRLTVNIMRIGGIMEPPAEFWPALKSFLDDTPEMLEEYNGIFFGNEIAQGRLKSVASYRRNSQKTCLLPVQFYVRPELIMTCAKRSLTVSTTALILMYLFDMGATVMTVP